MVFILLAIMIIGSILVSIIGVIMCAKELGNMKTKDDLPVGIEKALEKRNRLRNQKEAMELNRQKGIKAKEKAKTEV